MWNYLTYDQSLRLILWASRKSPLIPSITDEETEKQNAGQTIL
jgi:hypothetical protein